MTQIPRSFRKATGDLMGERAVKDRAHRTLAGENVARRAGRPRVVDSSVLLDSLIVLDGLGGDRGGDFGGIGYLGVRGSGGNGTGGFAGSECQSHKQCHKGEYAKFLHETLFLVTSLSQAARQVRRGSKVKYLNGNPKGKNPLTGLPSIRCSLSHFLRRAIACLSVSLSIPNVLELVGVIDAE